jgi:hypothetical protein
VLLRALAASVLPWCLGCATATAVLHEPTSGGRGYSYAAHVDSLATAAARALERQGLTLVRDTVVSSTRLLLGSGGITFTSWGELDRVAITPSAMGAEVRIISRPNGLDFLHQDRSPRLFQELDRELGGSAIRPFAGDRVRLILSAPESRTLTGTVLPSADTAALRVQARGQTRVIPTGNLAGISVSRGSYGHAKEGGLLGLLGGGLIGSIVVSPESSDWSGVEHLAGFVIGSLVGFATGSVIGATVRTEVWSEVSPAR